MPILVRTRVKPLYKATVLCAYTATTSGILTLMRKSLLPALHQSWSLTMFECQKELFRGRELVMVAVAHTLQVGMLQLLHFQIFCSCGVPHLQHTRSYFCSRSHETLRSYGGMDRVIAGFDGLARRMQICAIWLPVVASKTGSFIRKSLVIVLEIN